jgi:5'-3' exoribonuclease 2
LFSLSDFLPHLPTLDIGEGGLDTLLQIYREELPQMAGYIFDRRSINWSRLERITRRMGALEEAVFAERQEAAIEFAKKQRKKDRREAARAVIEVAEDELFDGELSSPSPDPAALLAGLEELEEEKKESAPAAPVAKIFDSQLSMLIRAKDAPVEHDEHGNALDYESLSFKARYYREKFPEFFDRGMALLRENSGTESGANSRENIRRLVQNYAQGLKWVAAYYYEGCRSWKWYFAYRYAPLASDLVDLDQLDLTLPLGYPFRPMEQLLGVLPPASGKFLPPAYRALMDPRTSSVADFYPLDFSIDMNGKRSSWG